MVKENRPGSVTGPITGPIDCACVIHGDGYTWDYVDRLYSMLSRHISVGVKLHVYTEAERFVPAPYIKHELENWNISGPKKSWWYKLQIFNSMHYRGPLLYFDLDTVIIKNIDWIWQLPLNHLWAVRDFKYLWRPTYTGINSSVLWFDTAKFEYLWQTFKAQDFLKTITRYHGDQDYINETIPPGDRRLFDQTRLKSWRWECLDGGYEFTKKRHFKPNTGTIVPESTSILIFHGKPKPNEVLDPIIIQNWQ
jgi:hypothetical protein